MGEPSQKLANEPEGALEEQGVETPEVRPPAVEDIRKFTLRDRMKIWATSIVGYLAVLLIGRSLRWEVMGWENWEAARKTGRGLIYTFWHREIFPATWFWRKRGIVVMTSRNFDGEYIARIIRKHGYGAARGSSTRGASQALGEMVECLRRGRDAAFTIDGPRGPRFVAKRGSVLLAEATGATILCFHVALRSAYAFKRSWDLFQIPYPFSRAAMFIAPSIRLSPKPDKQERAGKLHEVQAALEELVKRGEEWLRSQQRAAERVKSQESKGKL